MATRSLAGNGIRGPGPRRGHAGHCEIPFALSIGEAPDTTLPYRNSALTASAVRDNCWCGPRGGRRDSVPGCLRTHPSARNVRSSIPALDCDGPLGRRPYGALRRGKSYSWFRKVIPQGFLGRRFEPVDESPTIHWFRHGFPERRLEVVSSLPIARLPSERNGGKLEIPVLANSMLFWPLKAMPIEDGITQRLKDLSVEAERLRRGNSIGQVLSEVHRQECVGWISAALNVVQLACPDSANAYRKKAEEIAADWRGLMIPTRVGELAELIKNLSTDLQAGLLAIAGRARAATFEDFLEHAYAYLGEGRWQPAGVIAGVVFEDTIRTICRKHKIEEKGRKLDDLISEVAKVGVISGTKAKRARAAAHVRTKATHAQWDEFDLSDVSAAIDFTREVVDSELGT